VIATLSLIAAWRLELTHIEFLLLLFTISLVITSEMVNTSIESVTDLLTKEYRLEAKIAKDVAAGMVLTSSLLAVVVGLVIFAPHLYNLAFNH
jgi:diacylglycerol kinase